MIDPVYEKALEIKNELIKRLEAALRSAPKPLFRKALEHWPIPMDRGYANWYRTVRDPIFRDVGEQSR